jgi:AcrR family transcriptional regulator
MTRSESQAQTRSELLEAAGRAFARRGYDGASVAEIAEEAGFSHGAVYSNFEGKEDLFLALYEQWVAERVAEIEAVWAAGGAPAERARAAAEEWLERVRHDPWVFLLRLEFVIRGVHDPELRRKLATRVGAVPLAMRRFIEGALREEGLPAGGADRAARALQALSLGLALEALSDPDSVPPGLAGDLAGLVIESLARSAKRAGR